MLTEVQRDLTSSQVESNLTQLSDVLTNLASNPGHPTFQEQVGQLRQQLQVQLTASRINHMPALDQEILDELGLRSRLGAGLLARIDEAFNVTEITPAVSQVAIRSIVEELAEMRNHLDSTIAGLSYLGLEPEQPPVGAAEIAVLVPRAAVGEEADTFARALQTLVKEIRPFEEAVTGESPRPLRLASLSSSDYGVYFDVLPSVGAAIAQAVAYILVQYQTILQIRSLRQELMESGVPDDKLDGVQEFANDKMRVAIQEYVDGFEFHASISQPRVSELKISITQSMNTITGQIDRGYNIDVRAGDDPEEATEAQEGVAEALQSIRDTGPSLAFLNATGAPLLSLDGGVPEDDSSGDVTTP